MDFSTAGMGFVMSMNPAALAGAPHTFIATVYAAPEAEGPILRDLATAYPNITAIRVRDAIDRVSEALGGHRAGDGLGGGGDAADRLRRADRRGGGGRAGAGLRGGGAEDAWRDARRASWRSFALRSALLGAAAGLVAIVAGALAGWAVMRFVMEGDYRVRAVSALAIVLGGVIATLLAGLAFAWRPLGARPAQVLRAQD